MNGKADIASYVVVCLYFLVSSASSVNITCAILFHVTPESNGAFTFTVLEYLDTVNADFLNTNQTSDNHLQLIPVWVEEDDNATVSIMSDVHNKTPIAVVLSMTPIAPPFVKWATEKRIILMTANDVQPNSEPSSPVLSTTPSVQSITDSLSILIKYFGWTYFQVVYQDVSYFRDIQEGLAQFTAPLDICSLKQYSVDVTSSEVYIQHIIRSLQDEVDTTAVLLLMDDLMLRRFLRTYSESNVANNFHFITTSMLLDGKYIQGHLGTISVGRRTHVKRFATVKDTTWPVEYQKLPVWVAQVISILNDVLESDNCCSVLEIGTYNKTIVYTYLTSKGKLDVFNYKQSGVNDTGYWEKVFEFKSGNISKIKNPTFYDRYNGTIRGIPTSVSRPFRTECRELIDYVKITHNPMAKADIYFLGILPIHERKNSPSGCGTIKEEIALLSEAMVYGVEKLNKDIHILENMTLGYIILDSCSVPSRIIHQIDQLMLDTKMASKILGAVGFMHSEDYVPLADYLTSRNLVALSTHAVDPLLSNKDMYPKFMRMVPSSTEEVGAMLKLLQAIRVTHVGLLHSDSEYGHENARMFQEMSESYNISVGYVMRVEDNFLGKNETMDHLVTTFVGNNLHCTRVVVTFVESKVMLSIIQAANRTVLKEITWIGSSSWFFGQHVTDLHTEYHHIVENALIVQIRTHNLEEFDEHIIQYATHNITNVTENAFLTELLQTLDCRLASNATSSCIHNFQTVNLGVNIVTDAVRALSIGIEQLLKWYCTTTDILCTSAIDNLHLLPKIIYDNPFVGSAGNKMIFDTKYNGPAVYDILQLRRNDRDFSITFKEVGIIDMSGERLKLKASNLDQINITFTKTNITGCLKLPNDVLSRPYVYIDGDPMIYAFIRVTEYSDKKHCSGDVDLDGFQDAEAIIWSINEINKNSELLGNLSLGLALYDTCGGSLKTESLVQGVLTPSMMVSRGTNVLPERLTLGVIGGTTILGSLAIEHGVEEVNEDIPVIISTPAEVSDHKLHAHLFRTTLSPFENMDLSLKLCKYFKWTVVHLVHDSAFSGNIDYLETLLQKEDICVASRNRVLNTWDSGDWNDMISLMMDTEGVTGVVVELEETQIRNFFAAVSTMGADGKLFFVIPYDIQYIGLLMKGYENTMLGLTTVNIQVNHNQNFLDHLIKLNPSHAYSNPWFEEFWEKANDCNLKNSDKYNHDCRPDTRTNTTVLLQPSKDSVAVTNAVYALAKALENILEDCKRSYWDCAKSNQTGFYHQMERYLQTIQVKPPGGELFTFHDKNAVIKQEIINLQRSPDGTTRFVTVGKFTKGSLYIDKRKMSFYRNSERVIPTSNCTDMCFVCMNQTLINAYSLKVSQLVNSGTQLRQSLTDAHGVIILILIGIGFMVVGITAYYFAKFYSHKVFHLYADSDLGLIIGSILMLLCSVVHLFSGTVLFCTLQITLPCISYSVLLGSLLIKISKAASIQGLIGQKQSKVPRWDFGFIYITPMFAFSLGIYLSWVFGDYVSMVHEVPTLSSITTIEDITINWYCQFEQLDVTLHLAPLWFVIVELCVLSIWFRFRRSEISEVKQVMWSSLVTFLIIAIISLVLILSKNISVYSVICSIFFPLNSMIVLYLNMMPSIVKMIEEEEKRQHFIHFMRTEKISKLASLWKTEAKRHQGTPDLSAARKNSQESSLGLKPKLNVAAATKRWKKGLDSIGTKNDTDISETRT